MNEVKYTFYIHHILKSYNKYEFLLYRRIGLHDKVFILIHNRKK